MRLDDLSISKFKWVFTDFPNITLITKSITYGEVQVMYAHMSVGNKPLGEIVTNFDLAGSLEAPAVVTNDVERSFAVAGNKICLPTIEVLLRIAAGDLSMSKKL